MNRSHGRRHAGCSKPKRICRAAPPPVPPAPPVCPVPEASASSTLPATELFFFPVELPGFPPGLEAAILVGDPFNQTAFCQFFKYRIRFPAGYMTPVHFFLKTAYMTVISGTLQHQPQGRPAVILGPGDTFVTAPGSPTTNTTSEIALTEVVIEVTGVGPATITAV